MTMKSLPILITLFAASYVFPQNAIRSVDFKNFTYEAEFCAAEVSNKITVTDGEFFEEKEVDGYVDRRYFSVFGFTYGDLTGDGQEEAVILSVCNTGGTGNFTEAYIYTMSGDEPKRLVTLEGGDRAFGGLREVRIDNGILIVEASDAGEFGGACCPEYVVTRKYRLKNGVLNETERPDRKELYPASSLAFEKGKDSIVVEVELDDDPGIRRFVVKASQGQTLKVSSESENVRFRLLKGEAEIEEENKVLEAELLEIGDYVFEVRNFGEGALKTRITVTIR